MEVSHGPLGGAERPFTSVLFTCWMSTTLDMLFPPEPLRSRISGYITGITRQRGFFFSPSQQNSEHSVQADSNPEAANKDRVGC